ncbi:MAG: ATP-binding protein [Acidobacteriaceae bacterium]
MSASERAGHGFRRNAEVSVDSRLDPANLLDLYEHAPSSYLLLGMDGRILHANAVFRRIMELPETEAPERNFRHFLTQAGVIFFDTQIIHMLLLSGVRDEIALDLVPPSGERIPMLASAALRYDAEAKPSSIRMILLQATERLQYERDLLRSRKEAEQMAEVVRQSSDAIITMHPDGTVRMWNRGAADMFGYDADEVIGRSFVSLIFPADRRLEFDRAVVAIHRGEEVMAEAVGINKASQQLDLSISLTPHMEAPGILVAFSAIVRNVTPQKIAQRAVLQSEKLASVGRLASSIAHEINNPLAAVTNLLYLADSQAQTSEVKKLIGAAQDELSRVSQIATHTLRFYRQNSARSYLDLKELFESVLALNRARLRNSEITGRIARADSAPLFCYEGELRHIVLNIVSNALDAMKRGGVLTLSAGEITWWSTGQKGVRITIADNGPGMEQEILAHIFEPFFSTKGIGGTGLGLWVAKDLVQRNGGFIRARSRTRENTHGSVFVLFFPHEVQVP